MHLGQGGKDFGAARLRAVEKRVFVDFLRLIGVPDENQLNLGVFAGQEKIQQRKKALRQIFAGLVHGRGYIHEAEHDRRRAR